MGVSRPARDGDAPVGAAPVAMAPSPESGQAPMGQARDVVSVFGLLRRRVLRGFFPAVATRLSRLLLHKRRKKATSQAKVPEPSQGLETLEPKKTDLRDVSFSSSAEGHSCARVHNGQERTEGQSPHSTADQTTQAGRQIR